MTDELNHSLPLYYRLELLSRVVEGVSQGIVITAPTAFDNPIIFANVGFERMTGYSATEVEGQNCRLLQGPATESNSITKIREAIRTERECSVKLLNYKKDGTTFWNCLSITPVRDANGKLIHFVAVLNDVTERHKLEQGFLSSQKTDTRIFVNVEIPHEFSTLLVIIMGYSEVILAEKCQGGHLREFVERIFDAGYRAHTRLYELLSFSHKAMQHPTVLDINVVICQMEDMIRRLVGRDTSLVTTLAPSLSQVKIDPLQMAQVVTNLGINAHNAMPNGGKLTLETRNVEFDDQLAKTYPDIRVGKYVMLSATDIGMTTEVNSERFETFFSTEDVDDRIDQSLLAVRGIVKHYGGHIEIESEPNGGTTIKLYFPVTEDEINS